MKIHTGLWGKKKEKNGQYYWLPLEQHLLDASNVMIQLWNHWLSEGQKEYILKSTASGEDEVIKLISFIGLSHDFGKATPSFFMKETWQNQSPDLDKVLLENFAKLGFTGLEDWKGIIALKSPHALASHVLLSNYGVGQDIASIVGGHHGKPVDDKLTIKKQRETYTANYYQFDNENESTKKWKKLQDDLFHWILEEAGYSNVSQLPHIEQPAQVLLQGLLIMADWIASNEEYFPLFHIDKNIEEFQEQRLEDAWEGWSTTYTWFPDYFSKIEEQYKKRFHFSPREIQEKFSQAINKMVNPGIIILEAPMGVGKTEAALLGVEQIAEKRKCSGMFFALPTQATSDGIFSRIKIWLDKIAQETGDDKSLQLVHGKAQFNEDYQELKNADSINIEDSHGTVLVNEWFTGRKTAILDDFVIGTIDQLLLAGLKQKHLSLRHLGLSKKVLVVDEVHAYDAYMSTYLDRVVEWLGAYQVPMIILSATLPAARRTKLLEAYFKGLGIKKASIESEYYDWSNTESYPLITYTDGNKLGQVRDFRKEKTKEVRIEVISEEDFLIKIRESLSKGGIAGIILNTVGRVQSTAKKLEYIFGEENISVLHSSFLAPDRRKKERKLLSEIGKNEARPEMKIIIGTQVLEQSLDIDFDVLFTDHAPIDLLFQRIGRLHRHKETERPENLKEAVTYVMGINGTADFESGSEKIYGNYLLTRTQLVLPNKILLPDDISSLVQKVYAEDEINVPSQIKEKYEQEKLKSELVIKEKEKNANTFRIARPYTPEEDSLIGWLSDSPKSGSEEAGLAKVRDGTDSIEVILVKRIKEKLFFLDGSTCIDQESLSSLAKKISQQTIRLPHIFNYKMDQLIEELEKLNLKELNQWQEEPWLKGSLGVILDENNSAVLLGYKIIYDEKYGLMYEKEEK